jgi:hypothetical protein
MIAFVKPSLLSSRGSWLRRAPFAILLSSLLPCSFAQTQSTPGNAADADASSSVHGTVLNRLTHQPIGRALVFTLDQQYGALTDDRGNFEFRFPRPPESATAESLTSATNSETLRTRQLRMLRNGQAHIFMARKPGFLENARNPSHNPATNGQSDFIIYLDPESLIVGYVRPQASASDLRFPVALYRRESIEGRENWTQVDNFTTWADGEFRFSNLAPGTYKLVTREQIDRDPFTFSQGGQLFGYTPTFFPGTSDFSSATAIHLAPGETFQANISPTRREYYPVKIPIANSEGTQQLIVHVYPLGHPGPGYSLGFNTAEQSIQGMLPDGSYTLQVETQGQPGSTGIQNFSVHGTALEGLPLNLIANPSLAVNVHEEFKSGQSVFQNDPAGPQDGSSNNAPVVRANVWVSLFPAEEFGLAAGANSQPFAGSQQHVLLIPNVRPGRYRVHVESALGFAASVLSGGTDLLQEPLVVSVGAANSPIEVTLRDDGPEVSGEIEDAAKADHSSPRSNVGRTQFHIYFLPLAVGSGQFREMIAAPDGTFSQHHLPPGNYRVLAFDSPQEDMSSMNEEELRKFESHTQVIRLVAGQKERLRLKVISEGDGQ